MHIESSNDPLNLLIKYAKRVIFFNCRTDILKFKVKNPFTKGQTIQRPEWPIPDQKGLFEFPPKQSLFIIQL